ncbi:hypothetical protein K461DRAFT_271136 [Myriangium duriaei CBS 260.36]|uniref:Uncharacterized protein n=1 Tax=Myriangium duriaei CBS 260.36 TaxID=1168546 RepID=A0A9P4ITU0_9PEZI|nr:hypothetical protein K461DRAFT_271136 [Myriangium duriaei CBS 260.36]
MDYIIPHVLQSPKDNNNNNNDDEGISGLEVKDEDSLDLKERRDKGDRDSNNKSFAYSKCNASVKHEKGRRGEPSMSDNLRDSLRLGSSNAAASIYKCKYKSKAKRLLNVY